MAEAKCTIDDFARASGDVECLAQGLAFLRDAVCLRVNGDPLLLQFAPAHYRELQGLYANAGAIVEACETHLNAVAATSGAVQVAGKVFPNAHLAALKVFETIEDKLLFACDKIAWAKKHRKEQLVRFDAELIEKSAPAVSELIWNTAADIDESGLTARIVMERTGVCEKWHQSGPAWSIDMPPGPFQLGSNSTICLEPLRIFGIEPTQPEEASIPDPDAKLVRNLRGRNRDLLLYLWRRENVPFDELRREVWHATDTSDKAIKAALSYLNQALTRECRSTIFAKHSGKLAYLKHSKKQPPENCQKTARTLT